MRNLNNIFKTNNRQAQRKILDKFDISKEDNNKTLNCLANTNGGGSVSKYAPRYYKFVEDNPDIVKIFCTFASTLKLILYGDINILPSKRAFETLSSDKKYIGFSFIPIYPEIERTTNFIYSIDELLNIIFGGNQELINSAKQIITEITEEEFYKID